MNISFFRSIIYDFNCDNYDEHEADSGMQKKGRLSKVTCLVDVLRITFEEGKKKRKNNKKTHSVSTLNILSYLIVIVIWS